MYVRLIVRNECEKLVKNQTSKVEQMDFTTGLRLSRDKQLVKRAMYRAHDWKMKSRARLDFLQLSRR